MLQHLHVSAFSCRARIVRIQVGRELALYHVPSLLDKRGRVATQSRIRAIAGDA